MVLPQAVVLHRLPGCFSSSALGSGSGFAVFLGGRIHLPEATRLRRRSLPDCSLERVSATLCLHHLQMGVRVVVLLCQQQPKFPSSRARLRSGLAFVPITSCGIFLSCPDISIDLLQRRADLAEGPTHLPRVGFPWAIRLAVQDYHGSLCYWASEAVRVWGAALGTNLCTPFLQTLVAPGATGLVVTICVTLSTARACDRGVSGPVTLRAPVRP